MTSQTTSQLHDRRLLRSTDDRMIGGVAAGLAEYLGVDPTVVRVVFAVFALCGGLGVPLYLAAWLLVPEQGSDRSLAERAVEHADRS